MYRSASPTVSHSSLHSMWILSFGYQCGFVHCELSMYSLSCAAWEEQMMKISETFELISKSIE